MTLKEAVVHDPTTEILIRKRVDLLQWRSSLQVRAPDLFSLPDGIAEQIESLPLCKLSVSPRLDRLATMSHSRELNIYEIAGNELSLHATVQVHDDERGEYCHLFWAVASSNAAADLLLSTRSWPVVDVFDSHGHYHYSISLEYCEPKWTYARAADLNQAISDVVTTDYHDNLNKFSHNLYMLQFCRTFHHYRIGGTGGYEPIGRVELHATGVTTSLCVASLGLPLVFIAHEVKEADSNASGRLGVRAYRLVEDASLLQPLNDAAQSSTWFDSFRMAWGLTSTTSCRLALSPSGARLCAVASHGDLVVLDLPSLSTRVAFTYISGSQPSQAVFVDDDDIVVCSRTGTIIRCRVDDLESELHAAKEPSKAEKNSNSLQSVDAIRQWWKAPLLLQSPAARHLFILQASFEMEAEERKLIDSRHPRARRAARLWAGFGWAWFKALLNMAVGAAATLPASVNQQLGVRFAVTHVPTFTLRQVFNQALRDHDYETARSLATKHPTLDINCVSREMWKRRCEERGSQLTSQDILDCLEWTTDACWLMEECISCRAESMEAQKELLRLGSRVSDKQSLHDEFTAHGRVRLSHASRVLQLVDSIPGHDNLSTERVEKRNVVLYLHLRDKSLLRCLQYFAEEGMVDVVDYGLRKHASILAPYRLHLLGYLPATTPLGVWKHLIMLDDSQQLAIDGDSDELEQWRKKADKELSQLVRRLDLGDLKDIRWILPKESSEDNNAIIVEWAEERAKLCDRNTGLVDDAIELLQWTSAHVKPIPELLSDWSDYALLSRLSRLTSLTFDIFKSLSPQSLIRYVVKHVGEPAAVAELSSLLSMVLKRAGNEEQARRETVRTLLRPFCRSSTRILSEISSREPHLLDHGLLHECLEWYEGHGSALVQSLAKLPMMDGRLAEFASCLLVYKVELTFKELMLALSSPDAGAARLEQMAMNAEPTNLSEWEQLKDDILGLANDVWKDTLPPDTALEVMGRVLLRSSSANDARLLNKFFDFAQTGDTSDKVAYDKSLQLVNEWANEKIHEADLPDDESWLDCVENVVKATKCDKAFRSLLTTLELVRLSRELSIPRPPRILLTTAPDTLLHEAVTTGNNYRQAKKIGRLVQLLAVSDTPVAVAISLCATRALVVNDTSALRAYLQKLLSAGARNLEVVYDLCITLLRKPDALPEQFVADVCTCAALNAPPHKLSEMAECIYDVTRATPAPELRARCLYIRPPSASHTTNWRADPFLADPSSFLLPNSNMAAEYDDTPEQAAEDDDRPPRKTEEEGADDADWGASW